MKLHREVVIGLLDNTKRQLPVIKLALNEVIEVTNCLNDRCVMYILLILTFNIYLVLLMHKLQGKQTVDYGKFISILYFRIAKKSGIIFSAY